MYGPTFGSAVLVGKAVAPRRNGFAPPVTQRIVRSEGFQFNDLAPDSGLQKSPLNIRCITAAKLGTPRYPFERLLCVITISLEMVKI